MNNQIPIPDDHVDDHIDNSIQQFISLENPQSFFLFAGAGSGKTYSLVKALGYVKEKYKKKLMLKSQKVAIITFTNAACDEITQRLLFDSLFNVSTIHSFAWSLIKGFTQDIKEFLIESLTDDIKVFESKLKLTEKQLSDKVSKEKRLNNLISIKQFTYNPNGNAKGKDSLNHSEVVKIAASFIEDKLTMQKILINKYPILLIDESQDTNKGFIKSLMSVQEKHGDKFCLGLIGDMMQRIYTDGEERLDQDLPSNWIPLEKKMNHRSGSRIVELINKIRSESDAKKQQARNDNKEGIVRLFIVNAKDGSKDKKENNVLVRMAAETTDILWNDRENVKALTLEHHMAASRLGFIEMYAPLYSIDSLKTGLQDGSLSGINLFSNLIFPLLQAKSCGNDFSVMKCLKKDSPLLHKDFFTTIKNNGAKQVEQLRLIDSVINELNEIYSSDRENVKFFNILQLVEKSNLFEVPESLKFFASMKESDFISYVKHAPSEADEKIAFAWAKFLNTPFCQIERYSQYVSGNSSFDTHQGVKGLEFERVMVVIDDDEAKGFLFSYDKLFGTKSLSKTDLNNEREGKETGIERTRRLFYVTCSRAKNSLAVVIYSNDIDKIKNILINKKWFEEHEIILM